MSSANDGLQYSGEFVVATYFPAGSVTKLLSTPEDVRRAIERMREMEVQQVFLEVYRDGHAAEEATLVRARDAMLAAGFRVGGGITTTWGEGFGRRSDSGREGNHGHLFCYSSPKTIEDLGRFCALGARLFDEFMLDDFFSTDCVCDDCLAAKGDDPWPLARNRRMTDFAARAVLAPAREANPNCTVIIKYPQWYDNFQEVGYDAVGQTGQFDAIWVGTETRNPHLDDLFGPVQQAQSWNVYQYLADIAPAGKTLGGWFDPYGCDEPSYVEQAYQTVLVGTRVMLLFNYDSLQRPQYRPMLDSLIGHMPRLRRWAAALGGCEPIGLAGYKPPHSVAAGELYVFDTLTMIGLPTTLHAHFPEGADALFLSGHALADADIVPKLRAHLDAGGSVLATAEFVRGIGARDAQELFGLVPIADAAREPQQALAVEMDGEDFPVAAGLDVHGVLEAGDCEVLLAWRGADRGGPLLARKRHGRAAALMLDVYTQSLADGGNMTRWVTLMELAAPILDRIRAAALEPLALTVRAPGRVGVYCFQNGPIAVCNYRNDPAEIELEALDPDRASALDSLTPEQDAAALVDRAPGRIKLRLPPRSRVLLARGS